MATEAFQWPLGDWLVVLAGLSLIGFAVQQVYAHRAIQTLSNAASRGCGRIAYEAARTTLIKWSGFKRSETKAAAFDLALSACDLVVGTGQQQDGIAASRA